MRVFVLNIVILLAAASASPAVAQTPPPIDAIRDKTALSDTDREEIRRRIDELVSQMEKANRVQERRETRAAFVAEFGNGSAPFRESAAALAVQALSRDAQRSRIAPDKEDYLVHDAILILASLKHVATRDVLTEALKSDVAGVRYRAAVGLTDLHKDLSAAAQYQPILNALSDAGSIEQEPAALGAIYKAIDFGAHAEKFDGHTAVSQALARILGGRAEMSSWPGYNPAHDVPGYELAGRLADEIQQPSPQLVRQLAAHLSNLVAMAAAEKGRVPPYVVEACETALHKLIAKQPNGLPTGVPRISDLIRNNADPKELEAALEKLIGGGSVIGLLNQPPWNLPAGLVESEPRG